MRKVLYLMGVLDDADIDWVARQGTVKSIEPGTLLIQEGQPTEYLYILLDGCLSVSVRGQQIASLYSGELVGEISFVDSRPPLATVAGEAPSRVLMVPRMAMQRKLREDRKFAANFYRAIAIFLANRLRTTTGRLGYGSAQQDNQESAADEIEDDLMDTASLAVVRFDNLLKRLQR